MQGLPLDIAVCKTFGEYGDGRPRCGAPRKLGRYTFSDGLNKYVQSRYGSVIRVALTA